MKLFDELDKSEVIIVEVEKLLDLLQKFYRENERKCCMNLSSGQEFNVYVQQVSLV